MTLKKAIKSINLSYSLIIIYFIVNLLTLMDFPVIHSDELWLKGIADEIALKKSFSVTEPFFDLYPRVVHPFRWLYNSVLIGLFSLLGSSAFTMRFASLIFGTTSLILFSKILSKRFANPVMVLLGTMLLSIDIQFVYGSHMGRQETFIMCLMLLGFLLFLSNPTPTRPFAYAFIVLLAMGVHPNSFILGVTFSALIFYQYLTKKESLLSLVKYFGTTVSGAVLYAIIGFKMNPTFVSGYLNYGSALGVDAPLMNRFEGFYWYFVKLYHQIGGTYDLMDIKIPLILSAILLIFWFWRFLAEFMNSKRHDVAFYPLVTVLAILLSLFIIGRYNQTAVLFLSPFILLMALETISWIDAKQIVAKRSVTVWFLLALVGLWGSNLYTNLEEYDRHRFYEVSYASMLHSLNDLVPENAVVLSNLNTIEAFDATNFYDVRNLGYLNEDKNAFEKYIKTRGITHIILHEEMEYFARNSERWGFLYVNLDYYESMQQYLEKKTQLIGSFENPLYAMRLSRYTGTYPWRTFVYEVLY